MKYRLAFGIAALAGLAACSNGSTANGNSPAADNSATPVAATPTPTSTPTPAPRDLDALLAYSDPAKCTLGPALEKIAYDHLFDNDSNDRTIPKDIRLPGFDKPVRSIVTHPQKDNASYFEAKLPVEGVWHGLPVTALTQVGYEESEMQPEPFITIDAPRATIVDTLRKAGFKLNADGKENDAQFKDKDGEQLTAETGMDDVAGGKFQFYCRVSSAE